MLLSNFFIFLRASSFLFLSIFDKSTVYKSTSFSAVFCAIFASLLAFFIASSDTTGPSTFSPSTISLPSPNNFLVNHLPTFPPGIIDFITDSKSISNNLVIHFVTSSKTPSINSLNLNGLSGSPHLNISNTAFIAKFIPAVAKSNKAKPPFKRVFILKSPPKIALIDENNSPNV